MDKKLRSKATTQPCWSRQETVSINTTRSQSRGQPQSKETNYDLHCLEAPRITRRMRLLQTTKATESQRCAICLSDFPAEYAVLKCKHRFCLECAISWWRKSSNCPFCREPFQELETNRHNLITFDSLPKLEPKKDIEFIPHCEMCWGQIEDSEASQICSQCRSVYWHQRCLNFSAEQWFCSQCANANRM